jgi:hypothetical protein
MCDKECYTKNGVESVRQSIYRKRKTKLRTYFCKECVGWHLTSAIGMTYPDVYQ